MVSSGALGWIPCVNSAQLGGVHPRSSSARPAPATAWILGTVAEGCIGAAPKSVLHIGGVGCG